jgi:diguanylate cyclase (GGDEF)-like protein/PAS domain S-box-containing protein
MQTLQELQHQLLIYAQDLHDLLNQQTLLQKRYQMVLQSQGRSDQSADVLLHAARHSVQLFLVTNNQGEITSASAAAQQALASGGQDLRTQFIWQFSHPDHLNTINDLLGKFLDRGTNGAAQQRKLMLFDRDKHGCAAYDALVIPVRKIDRLEIYWLLQAQTQSGWSDQDIQATLLMSGDCAEGLMITDAQGVIHSVNAAFSQITGFSAAQAMGQNPRLLKSDRQDTDFYRAFWTQLVDAGNWTGEFFNRRSDGHIYTEWKTVKAVCNANGETISYVCAFTDISHRAQDARQLAELAYRDALTGLPNRRYLDEQLTLAIAAASSKGSEMCVMYLDLDQFKPVNDQFGHGVGDQVLTEVGARLSASVRQSDTVARVGGDEFVILLQSPVSDEGVYGVASSILSALRAPIQVDLHSVNVGVSIGCARYPVDGDDAATLLQNADSAMYGAKRFGLEFSFFDTGAVAHPAPDLSFDIWRAVERSEMHLLYQPQVASDSSRKLRGCEVLLRWNHAIFGEVSPLTFIPIAEKNGAIIKLGEWVLETACMQLARWHTDGLSDLTLSVNVSSRQLQDPKFAAHLGQMLLNSGIDPSALELEIAETDAMLELRKPRSQLSQLRGLGVKVAIEDFGAGYSSLTGLRSLPVDRLKISQGFVHELAQSRDARAISDCLVGIGNAMGLQVTAGGVESLDQLNVLAAQGCGLVQGYFTGKPMSAPALLAWALQAAPPPDSGPT